MIYFFLSIIFFLSTVCAHIFLHRVLVSRHIVSYRSIYIFGFGFVTVLCIFFYLSVTFTSFSFWTTPYPLSASLIYAFLAFLYYIYFGNAYLGEDSPSSRIFFHLEKGPKTYEQILSYFSDESLVMQRITNLVDAGLVYRMPGQVYTISMKGKILMTVIEGYRALLSWNKGG